MKKYLSIGLLLTIICGSSAFASSTINVDGVMKDGLMSNGDMNEWENLRASGEYVDEENGVSGGQPYDVEKLGLFIDNNMMYFGLQTGFDLRANYIDNTNFVQAGDFIFDFGNNGSYELALDFSIDASNKITFTAYSGNISWNSTTDFKNYDNAINYTTNTNSTSGMVLRGDDHLQNRNTLYTWTSNGDDGAPWQADPSTPPSKPSNYENYQNSVYGKNEVIINGTPKLIDNTIEAAINLNLLSSNLIDLFDKNSIVTMLWQPECGNDFLEVKANYDYTPVPEPETFLLFGFGLLALSSAGRYRFNKKA